MSGFYERLSQEQAKEIDALRTQITALHAQVASLTAQVAAQKSHIHTLERHREQPSSSSTDERRLPAVKRECIENGALPAEDLGQPVAGLGAALHEPKTEDIDMTDGQAVVTVVSEDVPGDVACATDIAGLPAAPNAASVSAEIDEIPTVEIQDKDAIELAGSKGTHQTQRERGDDECSTSKRARPQPEVVISQPRKKARPPTHTPSESSSSPHPSASKSAGAFPDVSVAEASEWYHPEFCRERLRHAPIFSVSLDPAIRDITIRHGVIQKAFGGTWNSSWAVFDDLDRQKCGHNCARFLLSAAHSYQIPPRQPGGPGALLLTYNPWPEGPHKVLVKTEDDLYKYMGEYNLVEAEPVTAAEFQTLPHKTRRAWGTALCKLHNNREFLAAAALHKQLGRAATAQEIAAIISQKLEGELAMTAQGVLEAFAEGRMILRAWVMQCVGYDDDFQRKIVGHAGRAHIDNLVLLP